MNTQMQRGLHGTDQEDHLHPGLHSGGEHNHPHPAPHHEKKSVLKKVKAKAKKIKDTITKHGHHEHDEHDAHHHPRRHDVGPQYDYDEEEDDDDEIEVDPEVHGAPIYESKEVRTTTYIPGQVPSSVLPTVTVPQPTPQAAAAAPAMSGMGHYGTQHDAVAGGAHGTSTFSSPISVERRRANISNATPHLTREEHNLKDHKGFIPEQVGVSKHDDVVTFGGSQTHTGIGGRPTQQESPSLGYTGATKTHTGVGGRPTHPATPSLGYTGASQTCTGGNPETNLPNRSGTTGIGDRLTDLERDPQAPRWDREPSNYQSKVQDPSRGGGEQMGITQVLHSLDKMATHGDETKQRQAERTRMGQEESMIISKAGLAGENKSVGTQTQMPYDATTRSHGTSGVLTSTPGVMDKGISAKNAVASKLGFGGEGDNKLSPSSAIDYGKNVASTVYEKLAEAGGAVMSKMPSSHATTQTVTESLSPGEEDKALSDVITEKLHKTSDEGEEHKKGKVTFSAKVVRQLGREGEESAEDIDTGISGPAGGEPMVNMLKDTVTSWLGIKHDPEPSSLVWHDIPKDGNEGLSEQHQQGSETERKGRLQ